jgi:hypothetical protein
VLEPAERRGQRLAEQEVSSTFTVSNANPDADWKFPSCSACVSTALASSRFAGVVARSLPGVYTRSGEFAWPWHAL